MKNWFKNKFKDPTFYGQILSFIVVIFVAIYFVLFPSNLTALLSKPNEMGDFLSGTAGSLALIWLIVGYYLQRTELNQNTRALQEQAEATNQLFEINEKRFLREKQLDFIQSEVILKLINTVCENSIQIQLINLGAHAFDFSIIVNKNCEVNIHPKESIVRQQKHKNITKINFFDKHDKIYINFKEGDKVGTVFKFYIDYIDSINRSHTDHYFIANNKLIRSGDAVNKELISSKLD